MVAGTASSAEWEIPSIMALMYQQPGLWSLLTLGKKKVFQPATGAESRRVHDELLVDSAGGTMCVGIRVFGLARKGMDAVAA